MPPCAGRGGVRVPRMRHRGPRARPLRHRGRARHGEQRVTLLPVRQAAATANPPTKPRRSASRRRANQPGGVRRHLSSPSDKVPRPCPLPPPLPPKMPIYIYMQLSGVGRAVRGGDGCVLILVLELIQVVHVAGHTFEDRHDVGAHGKPGREREDLATHPQGDAVSEIARSHARTCAGGERWGLRA